MTAQPSLFDPPTQRTSTLPHQGLSRIARECSIEAAHAAAPRRGRLQERYLLCLEVLGSATDHAAAKYLGVPLSSICSTRGALREQIEAVGKRMGPFGTSVTLFALKPERISEQP
jgi:hypothetical protein